MTKQKLWQKNWQLNTTIEQFETGGDLVLDQKLVDYDVYGSLAHAKGLNKIGLLTIKEMLLIKKGLKQIVALNKQGKFKLKMGDEDVHTKIENYLTQKFGQVGKKIHTGRSRNDQVLTAVRLYTKDKIFAIWQETLALIETLIVFASKYKNIPLPGYTHMQKAMPSTVSMWVAALAESLIDNLTVLKTAFELNDQSPLGSAAGYGVSLNLPSEYTSALLGFAKVQNNPIYCQNSRGNIEAIVTTSLVSILSTINKLATDVLLFTTSEFNYFKIDDELCSGSSIMPQKKNIDIAELLRSKVHLVLGNYVQLVGLANNLPSGFNRDLQDSKKPLFESLEIALTSIGVAKILVKNINLNVEILKKAMTPELFATQHALNLVKQGVPFREAYLRSAKDLAKGKIKVDFSALGYLSKYLNAKELSAQLIKEKKELKLKQNKFNSAINKLFI